MKPLIIYKSRTGFTKQYAEWISAELGCEAKDFSEKNKISFDNVDMIIYGGRVHAGMIDSIEKMKEFAADKNCKLVVFATGASPAAIKEDVQAMWKNNKIDDTIPHFYMQSGLRYENMGAGDKLMMKMFASMMKSKKDKSEMEVGMAEAIQKSFDESSKDYIKPLVEYVKGQEASE